MFLEKNGPHARVKAIFIGVTVSFIFSTVFVFARIVSRFYILRDWKWDDISIFVAWTFAFGMSSTIDFSTSRGLGLQESYIPASWRASLLASEYAAFILYNPALIATKTSILILYIRISKNTRPFLRWASSATLVVVIIAGITLTFMTIFQCRPVRAAYIPNIKEAQCFSIETIFLASAPINVATDLAILVLPIPVLTAMKLPRRQKFILVLTFLVGVLVTVIDVVRIYYLELGSASLDRLSRGNTTTSLKFSYNASLSLLWSVFEVNVGIICACIPVMRPLIKRVFRSKMFLCCSNYTSAKRAPLPGPSPSRGALDAYNSEVPQQMPQAMGGEHQIQIMDQTQTLDNNPRGMAVEVGSTHNHLSEDYARSSLARPRCMVYIGDAESFKYCAMVTVIYAIWGFAFALLIVLNSIIPIADNPTPVQRLGMRVASFSGRVFGPLLLGIWVLRRVGFKATFVTGLGIYCIGTLMFWPSGYMKSYPGFLVSNFVVGFGLALVMAATYGFLTSCGPPHHAEFRVCLSTGVETASSVLGEILATKVLFTSVVRSGSLIAVQWTYLASALSTAIIALCFHYLPLPDATDAELEAQVEQLGIAPSKKILGKFPVFLITFIVAIVSMIVNNGAWACNDAFFLELVSSVASITVSTVIFAFLCLIMPSHVVLLLSYIGTVTFAGLIMLNLPSVNGTLAINLVFTIFESASFPLIFAIALRGLGRWTKLAVCLLTSSTGIGPCVFPFLMLIVVQTHTVRYAFCIVVALFSASTIFPLYLILSPPARKQFNAVSKPPTGLHQRSRSNTSLPASLE